jgi:hypothetical protein
MVSTQKCIIASFALIIGIGFGLALSRVVTLDSAPSSDNIIPTIAYTPKQTSLKQELLPSLEERFGTSTSGFTANQIMYVYPGITPSDFDTVVSVGGSYIYKDSFLWYQGADEENMLADEGYITLQKNIKTRLGDKGHVTHPEFLEIIKAPISGVEDVPEEGVVESPSENPDTPVESPDQVMCPMDAKQCPDGSFVSRVAPSCAFAECPGGDTPKQSVMCTPEQREAEACIEIYAPVCAEQEVQCIKAPCDPVPTTYPNSCFACAEDRVISYTEGACEVPTQ